MKHVLSILALAAASLAGPAHAAPAGGSVGYRAVASGPAEAPPNGSPGSSLVTVDISNTRLTVEAPFRDLLGNATMSHIHCCTTQAFVGTAPVALPFDDFPTGVTSGNYNHAFPLFDEASYAPAFLNAHGATAQGASSALIDGINANEAYVNIHTSGYPGGEIRGFLVAAPIPEPAEWALLGTGLAGLLWMGRRRRRELSVQRSWQR